MAAYGSWRKQGKTDKQAQANLLKLWKNVVVQDTSARAALTTFNSGKGDVMLAYENEAYFSRMQGLNLQWVIPKTTILIENPIAVTKDSSEQGSRERLPALPPDARRAAGLRRLRLPARGEERREREPQEVPGPTRALHDRPARPRRLGQGAEALLRPVEQHHGSFPAPGRREHRLTEIAVSRPRRSGATKDRAATALSFGVVTTFLMVIVGLPLAALVWEATSEGSQSFWDAVSSPEAVAALKLTVGASLAVSLLNAVLGTITAWVLIRDDFRGKTLVNAIIDLPFALPTIVAGLTLLALYGPTSPVGIDVAFTRTAIVLALMFVTLPFVVRTVQPVLQELDPELEEAAQSLGASTTTTFRRIVLPNILPGILSGVALAFAKAVGEFGSLVIITGNIPFKTEVSSVHIYGRIESGDSAGAAAVAVVLLGISFATLLSIGAIRHYATRHDR